MISPFVHADLHSLNHALPNGGLPSYDVMFCPRLRSISDRWRTTMLQATLCSNMIQPSQTWSISKGRRMQQQHPHCAGSVTTLSQLDPLRLSLFSFLFFWFICFGCLEVTVVPNGPIVPPHPLPLPPSLMIIALSRGGSMLPSYTC